MQNQKFRQRVKKLGGAVIITAVLILLCSFIAGLFCLRGSYGLLDLLAKLEVHLGTKKEEFAGALLDIPAIALSIPVISGVSPRELEKAVGWYEESSLPGEGNTAIAGHRVMHGAQFRQLHLLKPGDAIILKYRLKTYTYRVEKIFISDNNDWSIVEPVGRVALTLTTGYPGDRGKRMVVRALLVGDADE